MGRIVIISVWALKIKIYPDGYLNKHKCRLCVREKLETDGVDYFDTYPPVFQWSTVILLLIVAFIFNLEKK